MLSSRRVKLDPTLYPTEAVDQAIAAFANVARIRPDDQSPEWLTIESDLDETAAVDEFLNYALMAALELHLAQP